MIIDSHCHVCDIKNYKPSEKVLPVTVGYSHSSNVKTVEAAKKYKLPFVLGIAPQTAIKSDLSGLDEWMGFIRENKPSAVGEIGLDFHWSETDMDVEKEKIVFKRMLDLAEEMELPIVIHARKAAKEVLDTLQLRNFRLPFMMHFFSGSLSDAKRAVEMGGTISIAPVRSKERKSVIKFLELDNLVVETDAPYVVRSPEDVVKSIQYVAEIKGIDFDEVAEKTSLNSARFFNIKRDLIV